MSIFSANSSAIPDATAVLEERLDELELAGYQPSGDAVDQQAAAWFIAQQEGLSPRRETLLAHWLASSPTHQRAFDRYVATSRELDALPAPELDALRQKLKNTHSRPRVSVKSPERREWLLGAGRWIPQAAVAAGVIGLVGGGSWLAFERLEQAPIFERQYATQRGQKTSVTLPDGSVIHLDTATSIDVVLYRNRREVRLNEGQVLFDVSHDPSHPFDVLGGALRVTVLGTRFSVRHVQGVDRGGTQVSVEHGRVRVAALIQSTTESRDSDLSSTIILTDGQAITLEASNRLGQVTNISASAVAPWRDGRVAFDATPLSEALAEFERYGDTGLAIHDPVVASMRVNGSFDVSKAENFAKGLTRVLPLALKRGSDGSRTEIVRAP